MKDAADLVLRKHVNGWEFIAPPGFAMSIGQPRIEMVSDRHWKLVIDLNDAVGGMMRDEYELPCLPEPPAAAAMLADAGRQLASAAHELACVLKEKNK